MFSLRVPALPVSRSTRSFRCVAANAKKGKGNNKNKNAFLDILKNRTDADNEQVRKEWSRLDCALFLPCVYHTHTHTMHSTHRDKHAHTTKHLQSCAVRTSPCVSPTHAPHAVHLLHCVCCVLCTAPGRTAWPRGAGPADAHRGLLLPRLWQVSRARHAAGRNAFRGGSASQHPSAAHCCVAVGRAWLAVRASQRPHERSHVCVHACV